MAEVLVRRNLPGTARENLNAWPEQELDDIDSSLAIEQYIQEMVRRDPTTVERIVALPDEDQDVGIWKYEQLRQFCLELNDLAVELSTECTCDIMDASADLEYRCAAHKTPQECNAMSYIFHTLDAAAQLLTSEKLFPSRLTVSEDSVNKLPSLARRLYRVFSHANFRHKALFDRFESERRLCARFHAFVRTFNVLPEDQLIVPLEA